MSTTEYPRTARVERSYWAAPRDADAGGRFDTESDALEYAIAREDDAGRTGEVVVELRWVMVWKPTPEHPSGYGDRVADRTVYRSVAEARKALPSRP